MIETQNLSNWYRKDSVIDRSENVGVLIVVGWMRTDMLMSLHKWRNVVDDANYVRSFL